MLLRHADKQELAAALRKAKEDGVKLEICAEGLQALVQQLLQVLAKRGLLPAPLSVSAVQGCWQGRQGLTAVLPTSLQAASPAVDYDGLELAALLLTTTVDADIG